MATDPAVSGPSVWLQLVQQEVENAGIGNSSNGFAHPIFTGADLSDMRREPLVLPSPELEIENTATDNGGFSTTHFADPIFIDFSDQCHTLAGVDEDLAIVPVPLELEVNSDVGIHQAGYDAEEGLVVPEISPPRSEEDNGVDALYLGPLELVREESEVDNNTTHICRNSCDPDDENTDSVSSLDALVELGCQCRGSMSRMCIKCLLKWFGPRIMLERDTTCEVCQTRLNESVKKTVLRALADHTGRREILIEALGPPLVRAHNAREGLGRVDPIVEEDDNVNGNLLPNISNGAAHASLARDAPPTDAPPTTPVSASTDSDLAARAPIRAPILLRRRPFWTTIRRCVCCAMPTPVLEPQ